MKDSEAPPMPVRKRQAQALERRDCRQVSPLRSPRSPGGSVRFRDPFTLLLPRAPARLRRTCSVAVRASPACRCTPASAGRCSRRTSDRSPSAALSGRGARSRSAWSPIRRTDRQRCRRPCCCSAARARSARPASPSGGCGSPRASSPPTASIAICRRYQGSFSPATWQ